MPTYDPRYAKAWRVERARGGKRIIDAAPTALHIATLRGAGWSLRAIAGAAGLSPTSVMRATTKTQINRTTAAKILAVSPETVPVTPSRQTTEPFVPRIGTRRRLEALLFMGWTWAHLFKQYGIRPAYAHQQGRWVTRSTHDLVARAYRDLSAKPGPSERTRRRARDRGYLGPTAWEDIDTDTEPEDLTPLEVVASDELDEVAVQRRADGDMSVELTTAERLEVVRRLNRLGHTDTEIGRRTGIHADQVARDRHQLGLPANARATKHPIPSDYFGSRRRKAAS